VTDPETTPAPASSEATRGQQARRAASAWDRITASLQRLASHVSELVRRGNRRRLTLRDRDANVWLRLPLTLAVILVILVSASWAFLLVLVAAILLLAFGFQVSVERAVDDARTGPDAPTSAA
jgi:uncharacterized membrane protein YhaH (DUF805 family)